MGSPEERAESFCARRVPGGTTYRRSKERSVRDEVGGPGHVTRAVDDSSNEDKPNAYRTHATPGPGDDSTTAAP